MTEERFVLSQSASLDRFCTYVVALQRTGPVELTAKPHKPKRSDEQNKLLWSIYSEIIKRGGEMMAGWTKDDLHELFLGLHFGWTELRIGTLKRRKPARRSSRLSTSEFHNFVEFILRYMAEQGVYIQTPEEAAA